MSYEVKMIQKTCEQCKKVIEGYTEKQVDYMLDQHKLVHKYKKEKITKKLTNPKEEIKIQEESSKETLEEQRKKYLEE